MFCVFLDSEFVYLASINHKAKLTARVVHFPPAIQRLSSGISLMTQWLRLPSFHWGQEGARGGERLIPGWGTKIPHATWCNQKIKKKIPRGHTLNHFFYPTLTHQTNIFCFLNQPRTRDLSTKDSLCAPKAL